MIFTKVFAFVKKDFIVETSYKMGFVIIMLASFYPVVSYFFISKMVSTDAPSMELYNGHYYSFALIGIAFSTYFISALSMFSGSLRRAQVAGCMEAILSSQTSSKTVVLYSSVFSFIVAFAPLLFAFFIGVVLFDFSFANINVGSTAVVVLLSLVTFISLGIFSAAGTVLFKQGEPFAWLFGGISSFLGGAYFPVQLMPEWAQAISRIVPITHSLDALRLTILKGSSLAIVQADVWYLLGMAVVFFPFSLYFYDWAIERGRRDGSLTQY
jgi:ABC-2 type transport system permease protein